MNEQFFFDVKLNELNTVQDMLRWAVSCFNSANIWYGHGTDNPWDEAIRLVLSSLHLPLYILENIHTAHLTLREKNLIIERIILRISKRIPVAYLTNKAWFCGHEFYIDERVLVPRSPISELINNRFSGLIQEKPQYILDMCTGSGCIAISCAYAFSEAKIEAVDISVDALIVAEYNIKKHNLIHHVTLICSDLFCNISKVKYDLIIANPPYVSLKDMPNLPDEYHYEPELGLTLGDDGLKLTRRILAYASDYLTENGILICEVGNNAARLTNEYPDVPFIWLEFSNGGDGIFILNKEQLISAREYFDV